MKALKTATMEEETTILKETPPVIKRVSVVAIELEDDEDEAVTEIYVPETSVSKPEYAVFHDPSAGVVGAAMKNAIKEWHGRFKSLLMSCMDISASPISQPSKKPSPYMTFHDPDAGAWGQSLRAMMRRLLLEERQEGPQSFVDPSAGVVGRKVRKTVRKFLQE